MNFSVTKRFKLFLIVALVIILAGMVVLGLCGFNNTVDYSGGYEVKVHVNQFTATDNTIEVTKDATEKYFADNGIKALSLNQQAEGVGLDLIYKFDIDVTAKCEGLEQAVQNALDTKAEVEGLTATVSALKFDSAFSSKTLIILAISIAAVVLFIYAIFAVKLSGAVAVLCSSVIATLLYVALVSVARVPVNPTGDIGGALTFAIAEILAIVTAHRLKETAALKEELSADELADVCVKQSLLRYAFIACALAIAALVLIIVGPAYLRFVGIQILVAALSALFSVIAFMPTVYIATSKNRNK